MQKAESLSFPTVSGSGGRGQSLLNKVCIGAKWLRLWFLWSFNVLWKLSPFFEIRKFITIPTYFSTIAKTIWCCDKVWFLGQQRNHWILTYYFWRSEETWHFKILLRKIWTESNNQFYIALIFIIVFHGEPWLMWI